MLVQIESHVYLVRDRKIVLLIVFELFIVFCYLSRVQYTEVPIYIL